jgi:hypothetical protein
MEWWIVLIVAAGVAGALGFSGWLLLRQGRVAEHAQEEAQNATYRRPPLRRESGPQRTVSRSRPEKQFSRRP